MTSSTTETVKIYNPFSDEWVYIAATVNWTFDKTKLVGAEIEDLINDHGVDLIEYLKDDYLDELEQNLINNHEG